MEKQKDIKYVHTMIALKMKIIKIIKLKKNLTQVIIII